MNFYWSAFLCFCAALFLALASCFASGAFAAGVMGSGSNGPCCQLCQPCQPCHPCHQLCPGCQTTAEEAAPSASSCSSGHRRDGFRVLVVLLPWWQDVAWALAEHLAAHSLLFQSSTLYGKLRRARYELRAQLVLLDILRGRASTAFQSATQTKFKAVASSPSRYPGHATGKCFAIRLCIIMLSS